ncbi:hybrid sensor histidine kinase/response regulator [Aquabacterium sp. J223]|uniref:hybrid sensor histidine kinase/response regulator n=1 Tax=Aquabacterium sp. J223 TaxID=2898431 RepID=UPI0021ADD238|nr:hybrid sensor histidine kinase/response regulator [Aquabacterium sp. J223]UUX94442.1 hybrid sensor histidine kinase/response regulator [Aquabacterium sp. J223]
MLGRDFALFFTEADRAAGLPGRELQHAVQEGRARTEGWRLRRDGSRFWAGVTITPVLADDGQLRGFAKVTRDLSVQRRLTALEVSSQRMSAFLAVLGHELRNPLAPIRNAASLLRRLPELPAPALHSAGIIERQLDHLVRLVDDLLDVGRIVTGKVVLQRRRLDWHEVVQASLEVARPLAQARQHDLTVDQPDEPLPVDGDLTRLVQALQNLLHNAVRYTAPGGRIALVVRRDADRLVTTVHDNGRGIAAADLERVFDLFVQAEATAGSADGGGLGIGLSLARTLVEGHGGSLVAASDGPGRGSCFTLRLPLAGGPQAGAATHRRTAPATPQRVLVIDDNHDSTDTMVELLRSLGHQALGAYGAAEALQQAAAFVPEVVLLDLHMPDGDGFSVIAELRRLPRPPRVFAMTGYGQQGDRRQTAAAGFDGHLTKPVAPAELEAALTPR